MLVIREVQERGMLEEMQQDLIRRIAADLRAHYTEIVSGLRDDELEQRVAIGVARAREYDFSRDTDLADFVSYMFLVAPNFDEYPPINKTLADANTPPEYRIENLLRKTTEEQWFEAKALWNDAIWR